MLPHDDGSDLDYNQGFDWVHGTGLYEESVVDLTTEEPYLDEEDDDEFEAESTQTDDNLGAKKMKLKDWKKKAKEMERRGEL